MKYLKYILIPVLLFIAHLFADSWTMIIIWSLLGIGLAFLPAVKRFPILLITLSELLVFFCFWFFIADVNGSLNILAQHAGMEILKLAVAVVLVNIITALLCTASFFLLLRKLINR
ncbi:hypothetical protein [Chitinophaga sp.]|uniref:hypothetical protein n=1 Tax=Chitinophaga sp. TaxID=1869181 RepID=UPI0031DC0433